MVTYSMLVSITPVPVVSLLIWIVLLILTLYLTRRVFHRLVLAAGRTVYSAMRLSRVALDSAAEKLRLRNREVLFATGLDLAESRLERHFDRVAASVQRDLQGYPGLQSAVGQMVAKLEEDHAQGSQIAPTLPDWARVIEAVARIEGRGDGVVALTLEQIQLTLVDQHRTNLARHRNDVAERQAILKRMSPVWQGVQKKMGRIESAIVALGQRAESVDRHIEAYEKIRSQSDAAGRQLTASTFVQLFVAVLMLSVVLAGAVINYNLMALPMSEMVGGNSFIGTFKTANVAALFMIGLQVLVGVFLMDACKLTRFFAILGNLTTQKRKIMSWSLFGVLIFLASIESSLAYLHERLLTDMQSLRSSLSGLEADPLQNLLSTVGQMAMGFVLPFVMACAAVPFEAFIRSLRTLLGMGVWVMLRILSFALRMIGHLAQAGTRLVSAVYDMVIFPALWIENILSRKRSLSTDSGRRRKDDPKADRAAEI